MNIHSYVIWLGSVPPTSHSVMYNVQHSAARLALGASGTAMLPVFHCDHENALTSCALQLSDMPSSSSSTHWARHLRCIGMRKAKSHEALVRIKNLIPLISLESMQKAEYIHGTLKSARHLCTYARINVWMNLLLVSFVFIMIQNSRLPCLQFSLFLTFAHMVSICVAIMSSLDDVLFVVATVFRVRCFFCTPMKISHDISNMRPLLPAPSNYKVGT